jgi:uncharacterized membrane protein
VAVATGKVDGMVFVGGLLAGMFFYAELSPILMPFVNSTSMGQVTLPQYFNLPVLGVAAAIIVMALAGFYGATVLERKFGNR